MERISTQKIIALIVVSFLFVNFIPLIKSEVIWTEYSDTAHIEITIVEAPTPAQASETEDEIILVKNPDIEEFETRIYGKWNCINNQYQRTNLVNGKSVTEFNGVCGLDFSTPKKQATLIWILPVAILFLIFLVSIALFIVIVKKY